MYKYASSCFIDFRSLVIAYGTQKIKKKDALTCLKYVRFCYVLLILFKLEFIIEFQ